MAKETITRYYCDNCGEKIDELYLDSLFTKSNSDPSKIRLEHICPACLGAVRGALESRKVGM